MDYVRLKQEILTDTAGLGYAGKTWQQIADLLNVRNQVASRSAIASSEIIEATVPSEYLGLSSACRQMYDTFIGAGPLNPNGKNTLKAFQSVFPSGSTIANLNILRTELKSRAEILGLGEVWPGHVGKALAIP